MNQKNHHNLSQYKIHVDKDTCIGKLNLSERFLARNILLDLCMDCLPKSLSSLLSFDDSEACCNREWPLKHMVHKRQRNFILR